MLRIGVVTAIPTPYRDPFWNEVAAIPETDLHIYYCASTTPDRPWKPSWHTRYTSEVLDGFNVMTAFPSHGFSFWNPRIVRRLRDGHHDALIVGGYNYPTMMAAMWYARRHRVPYFLMSESHLNEPRPAWRRVLKRPVTRWAVRGAAGCFPTGTWARDYLLHYGARRDRLWYVPNIPDVARLERRAAELAADRPELRRRFGLGDGPVALFVGRLVEFKRVDLLIEAFARASVPDSARLVIVGDGVVRPRLEAISARLGLSHRVRFEGFAEPSDVPLWYAAADLFVLPSIGETWSVAVLEALASGLPVVTTDTVGAAADAVDDPAAGTIVRSGDVAQLAAAISSRLADPAGRAKAAERWRSTRDRYRYDVVAHDVVEAIRKTVGTNRHTCSS